MDAAARRCCCLDAQQQGRRATGLGGDEEQRATSNSRCEPPASPTGGRGKRNGRRRKIQQIVKRIRTIEVTACAVNLATILTWPQCTGGQVNADHLRHRRRPGGVGRSLRRVSLAMRVDGCCDQQRPLPVSRPQEPEIPRSR